MVRFVGLVALMAVSAAAFQQNYLDSISKGNGKGGSDVPDPAFSNVPLEDATAYSTASEPQNPLLSSNADPERNGYPAPSSNDADEGWGAPASSDDSSTNTKTDPYLDYMKQMEQAYAEAKAYETAQRETFQSAGEESTTVEDVAGSAATTQPVTTATTQPQEPLPPGWAEYMDPASGQPYYHNAKDGITTWDRPKPIVVEELSTKASDGGENPDGEVSSDENNGASDQYLEYMKQMGQTVSDGTGTTTTTTEPVTTDKNDSGSAAAAVASTTPMPTQRTSPFLSQGNVGTVGASVTTKTIDASNIGIDDVLPFGNVPSFEYEEKPARGSTQKRNKKPSAITTTPLTLDALLEGQLNMMNTEKAQTMLEDLTKDYKTLLKKHMRLAITGGVPLNREMKGERIAPALNTRGMTERIMKSIRVENTYQATGAGGASTWEAFQKAEANWARLREYMPDPNESPPVPFVTEEGGYGNPRCYAKLYHQKARSLDFDVAVCGGTLGIFFATALQLKGNRVCVVEAGKLRGREQEWNISMEELLHLKKLGVITQADIDAAVQTEFPGCRSGFKNKEVPVKNGYLENGVGYECVTEGVLNLGVSPKILLERVSERFKSLGGVIQEETKLEGVCVVKDVGAALDFGDDKEPVTAGLVIDSMGNNSPITRQQRFGTKPDGVCVVVGTCASGFDPETNTMGDIIYTNTAIQDKGRDGGKMQYFWEAFPVGIGRNGKLPGTSNTKTTYMFTYMDADQKRPTLETLLEDYWRLLPQYQPSISNPEADLDVHRVLFAFFPTYKNSPLQPNFHRVLAVGDASGIQSPLSFGGFGALTRHLDRITTAVSEALSSNLVTKHDLAQINSYTPNLSAAWMFQKAMSVRMGQPFVDKRFVNRLLATNFEVMNDMGPRTIKPFLQDVVRFDGLVGSLTRSFLSDPTFMPQIVLWVGLPKVVEFLGHVGMMGTYAALDNYVAPWLGPIGNASMRKNRSRYQLNRKLDAWKYGSGNDYDVRRIPKQKP